MYMGEDADERIIMSYECANENQWLKAIKGCAMVMFMRWMLKESKGKQGSEKKTNIHHEEWQESV